MRQRGGVRRIKGEECKCRRKLRFKRMFRRPRGSVSNKSSISSIQEETKRDQELELRREKSSTLRKQKDSRVWCFKRTRDLRGH